jgi:hypothetical protein
VNKRCRQRDDVINELLSQNMGHFIASVALASSAGAMEARFLVWLGSRLISHFSNQRSYRPSLDSPEPQ